MVPKLGAGRRSGIRGIARAVVGAIITWPVLVGGFPTTASAASTTIEITPFSTPTANSQPPNVAADSSGKLWFTEQLGNKIGVVSTSGTGGVKEIAVPNCSSCSPGAITIGPDKNVWFAEGSPAKIAKLVPATGVITTFFAPFGDTFAAGMTAGPDGNIWFTDFNFNQVDKMTTAGVTTSFRLPGNPRPSGIAVGPDGNLWFAETSGSIGRITTSGTLTTFPIPTSSGYPNGITSGPGGLWFTESNSGKIGRITTQGVVTEFNIPTASSQPRGIATGPDRKLWFTESGANKIGTISSSGTINEYPAGANTFPFGIAMGWDGNMWFTEWGNAAIARARFPTVTPAPNPAWSGYAVSGSPFNFNTDPSGTAFSDVKGTWTIPKISASACAVGQPSSYVAIWVGLGGASAGAPLEQVGVLIQCDGTTGTVTYDAVYEILLDQSSKIVYIKSGVPGDIVMPGDKVTAEVLLLGTNQYRVLITDSTRGWSYPPSGTPTLTGGSSSSAHDTAEWIVEAPPFVDSNGVVHYNPLTNFGSVSFGSCKANGKAVTAGPTVNILNIANSAGKPEDQTSSPLTSYGAAFKVVWKSSGP